MSPELIALAHRQGGLFTRAQALEAGYPQWEIRRLIGKEWLAVVPGRYVRAATWSTLSDVERYRIRTLAMLAGKPSAVPSCLSAAVVHRLPLLAAPPPRVFLTKATGSVFEGPKLHIAVAPLPDEDLVVVDGVTVTSVARTVVDCARVLPFVDAVVIADAALQRKLVVPEALDVVVARQAGWPGAPAARRVVRFADGLAESPGESVSRVVFVELELPTPALQVHLKGGSGTTYRTDFYWEKYRTIGEFDGAVKYRGADGAKAVVAEKVREDDLRDAGNEVFRWIWSELYQQREALRRRALRAFARGERRP